MKRRNHWRRAKRLLIEQLESRFVMAGSISGMVFNDVNQNGTFDPAAGETPLAGQTIYIDLNHNGRLDPPAEPSTVSGSDGTYTFSNLQPGQYSVADVQSTDNAQTFPVQPRPTIRQLSLSANDIVYDPVTKRIYASLGSSASANSDSIAVIDPVTGAVGPFIPVGSNPGKIAISDNGQYLYVGLDGAFAVRRVDLTTLTAGLQFSLGSLVVEDIEVLPGNPNAVAIARRRTTGSPTQEGIAIYDDGVQRPDVAGYLDAIEFATDGSVLYAYNNQTTDFNFNRLAVTATGLNSIDETGGLISGFSADMEFDNGRMYTTTGRVFDPESKLPLGQFQATGSIEPDSSRGLTFFLNGSDLTAFDQQTFVKAGSLSVAGVSGSTSSLIHWGTNGLAFRSSGAQIFLVEWNPRTAVHQVSLAANQTVAGLDFGIHSTIAPGTISGKLFHDADGGGSLSPGEPGLAGWTLYLDDNANGQLDAGERSTVTDSAGNYQFSGLAPGTYRVAEVPRTNWQQTSPAIQSTAAVRAIGLPTNDLAYDTTHGVVYASVQSLAGALGNSVTAIDPVTGKILSSVFVDSEPNKLALSDDNQALYVSSNGAYSVQRIDVAALSTSLRFSLFPLLVDYMDVMPGNAAALAITPYDPRFTPRSDGVTIYDNGVPRPQTTDPGPPTIYNPRSIAFSDDPSVLYGYNNQTSSFDFDQMAVTDAGVSVTTTKQGLISGFNAEIEFDHGRIYATTGAVVDPQAATLLGKFAASGAVEPDFSRGLVFFVNGATLYAFDAQTFMEVGRVTLSGISLTSSSLIHWGSDGLAFRTGGGQVVFVNWDPRNAPTSREFTAVVASGQTVSGLNFGNLNTAPTDIPTATNDAYALNEDVPFSLAAPGVLTNDTDANMAPLTAIVVSGPSHGTLNLADNGSFTYTPNNNYNGADSFTYRANNGEALSLATVSLTIAAVNDAPSFTKGTDRNATDESGPRTVTGWAKNIKPGPSDEAAQQLSFIVTVDQPTLFAAQPAIDSAGTLTFTPAINAVGTAHVSVVLQDNGGTANGGTDTSPSQSFAITIRKLHPFHNSILPLDVNADGAISPDDVLAIINYINAFGPGSVPSQDQPTTTYCDVNADRFIAPGDALDVINYINAFGATGEGESYDSVLARNSVAVLQPTNELLALLAADVALAPKRRH